MRRAILPLLLLLPVACAQPDRPDPGAALQEAMAAHAASQAAIPGAPAARPAPAPPTTAPAAAPVAGAERVAGGPIPTMAQELLGQPPETVTAWLGPPRLRRDEGGAQVWHYQATQCHLDLVLYLEEGPRPAWRVAFAQARAVGAARRAEAACLRDIARGAARRDPAPLREQALAAG